MFKSLDIQKGMEVVGLDSKHVGTVDHLETADRIVLSKDDPKASGRQEKPRNNKQEAEIENDYNLSTFRKYSTRNTEISRINE